MDRLLEATYRVEQQHFWWKGLRGFVRPLLAEATAGRPDPRILDCGCGTGANLVMLGEFGHASGFDVLFRGLELRTSTASAGSRRRRLPAFRSAPSPSTW